MMKNKEIEILKNKLQENCLESGSDILLYIRTAGRLASLGDNEGLERLEKSNNRDQIDAVLAEECCKGIKELDELTGKELGNALVKAQDYWSFYLRTEEKDLYSPETADLLGEWGEKTTGIWGDEETVQVLNEFRETYPSFDEDDLLAVIDSPISEEDIDTACRAILEEETIETAWSDPSYCKTTEISVQEFVKECDSEIPAEELCAAQNMPAEFQLSEGRIVLTRRLTEDWKLILTISAPTGKVDKFDQVRIGFFYAERKGITNQWILDLKKYPPQTRAILLTASASIQIRGGGVIRINSILPKIRQTAQSTVQSTLTPQLEPDTVIVVPITLIPRLHNFNINNVLSFMACDDGNKDIPAEIISQTNVEAQMKIDGKSVTLTRSLNEKRILSFEFTDENDDPVPFDKVVIGGIACDLPKEGSGIWKIDLNQPENIKKSREICCPIDHLSIRLVKGNAEWRMNI